MKFLIFLQNLPLPTLLAVTVLLGLILSWAILGLVRLAFGFPELTPQSRCPYMI